MPRPPKNIELQPAFATTDEALRAGHTETLSREADLVAIKQGLSDDRDLLNQLLGQAQMADAFAQFSRTVRSSKLAFVKENKLYQALKGKMTPNGSELSGTWDEFCGLLGMSVDKADLDISNLKTFGEEALDSMSRMGIGYRELRQYRRLPEDQKSALIEAAKSGDKDSFLELAEDLIAKHAREKEEAQRQIEELKAEEKAKEELLADKNKLLDAERAKVKRIQAAPADERLDQLRKEITSIADDARGAIIGQLRAGLAALQDHHRDAGGDSDLWAAGVVGQLFKDLTIIRDEFGIPDLAGAEVPEWLAK